MKIYIIVQLFILMSIFVKLLNKKGKLIPIKKRIDSVKKHFFQ